MTKQEVKALIADKIKTNGEGAITAEVLADVLNAINEEGVLDASHLESGDEISADFVDKMRLSKEMIFGYLDGGCGLKIPFVTEEVYSSMYHSGLGITGLQDGGVVYNSAFGYVYGEGTSICVAFAFTDTNNEHFYFCYMEI